MIEKLDKWEQGSKNTKMFRVPTPHETEFLQGCRSCNEIVPLDNLFIERQMIGNVFQSLCNCSKCGKYIIFDEYKLDTLNDYLKE